MYFCETHIRGHNGRKNKIFCSEAESSAGGLLKVVEAKRLLDSGKAVSVQEAAENVGISRSSFYKYKDDIFPFHDNAKGKTITMVDQLDDEPGLLSVVLSDRGRLSCQYPDDSSEYSGQRNCFTDTECGCVK